MGLNAGQMDREIVLQTATASTDATTGQELDTWTDDTIWAQWVPAGTREAWQARQINSAIDGLFRIYDRSPRPSPDTARVVFDGRTFDVTGVMEMGRGEGLELAVVARGEA